MGFDRGHFVDSKHPIIVEVALLDAPAGESDLVVQDRGDAKDNAALNLSDQRVGIHDTAAICCNDNTGYSNISLIGSKRLRRRCSKPSIRGNSTFAPANPGPAGSTCKPGITVSINACFADAS